MTAPTAIDLPDAGIVFIRNNEPGPSVHTIDVSRSDGHIVWQGKGDPNGEDIQAVDVAHIRHNVNFMRSLRLGIFTVVDEPGAADLAMQHQQEAWAADQARRKNAGQELLEAPAENDLQMYSCLGDNCTHSIPMNLVDHAKKPPLCATHSWMASLFTALEDTALPLLHGKPQIVWVRPKMGTRETEQTMPTTITPTT